MKQVLFHTLILALFSVALGTALRLFQGSNYHCVCGSPFKLFFGGALWFTDWNPVGLLCGVTGHFLTVTLPGLLPLSLIETAPSQLLKAAGLWLLVAIWVGSGYAAWKLVCAG